MILTCPQCASRYFVDQDRIGPSGRTVKCASCGARWTAHQDEPLELKREATDDLGDASADPETIAPEAEAAQPLPKVFRERASERKKVREAAAAGAVWAGLAAGFVLLLAAGAMFRQNIAQLWPRTAGAYAMVGLPVNLVGLTIENQRAQPQLQDGHAALAVSGSLRNVRGRPVAAPPLRITLLNAAGKAVAVKIADPGGATIPPGQTRRFTVNVLDPPVSATDVDIGFVLDAPARPVVADAAPPPSPAQRPAQTPAQTPAQAPMPAAIQDTLALRGGDNAPVVAAPAAQEAKPLPASSPYALGSNAGPHG